MSRPFPTTIDGKLEMAMDYKVRGNIVCAAIIQYLWLNDWTSTGNELFTRELYKKAIIEYSKAISFTKGLPGRKQGLEGVSRVASDSTGSNEEKISPEQEIVTIDLEVTVKTNITTCYLRLNNGTKALDTIKEALVLRPMAWKSLMRQSEAYLLLGLTDKAMKSIDLALSSNRSTDNNQLIDSNIETNLLKVKDKIKKQMKKEDLHQRKTFGKIFERANDDSNSNQISLDNPPIQKTDVSSIINLAAAAHDANANDNDTSS